MFNIYSVTKNILALLDQFISFIIKPQNKHFVCINCVAKIGA